MPKSLFDTLVPSEVGEFNSLLKTHLLASFDIPEEEKKITFRFDEPNFKEAPINNSTLHLFM